jgi:hypothetical protein
MKKIPVGLAAAALLAGAVAAALAQSYPPPRVQSIGPNDLVKIVPGGNPAVGDQWMPATLFGNYPQTQPGNNPENALIGGDFSTGQNLWQRGVSVALASATYYVGYTADRWFAWGGTSTPATITQQADAPAGYLDSLQIVKGSLTGVVPVTIAQEVESDNSLQFQGQTAEFDCHLKALSGFSAASSQVLMTISYGTGTDEGSTDYAYGLNAHGGAGTTAWAGQINASVLVPITTSWGRYSIVAPIPTGATEVAAAIGFTPVGTGTATDGFKMAGCQLVRNSALTTVAGTTLGTATLLNAQQAPSAKAFARRLTAQEQVLQQRYYYQINEPAASKIVSQGGAYETATICDVAIKLPVSMRVAPTITIGGTAEGVGTWAVMSKTTTPVALASTYLIQDAVIGNTVDTIALQGTTASTTAGFACELVGAGGGANIQASAEL